MYLMSLWITCRAALPDPAHREKPESMPAEPKGSWSVAEGLTLREQNCWRVLTRK